MTPTFEILAAGIAEVRQGDVNFTGPSGPIGIAATNLPPDVRLRPMTARTQVFAYRSRDIDGVAVDVRVCCRAVYDGPEVQMTVELPADGVTARSGSEVHVAVGNPLGVQVVDAPEPWQRVGITGYPVVRVPFSVFVDEPWPAEYYRLSFLLVISGMTGFGAPGLPLYEELQEARE